MRHVVRRTAFPDFELKSFDLLGVGRLFSLRKTADGVSPAFGAEELQVENIPSAAQAVYLYKFLFCFTVTLFNKIGELFFFTCA